MIIEAFGEVTIGTSDELGAAVYYDAKRATLTTLVMSASGLLQSEVAVRLPDPVAYLTRFFEQLVMEAIA